MRSRLEKRLSHPKTLSQVLAEANEHFTYRGKAIHPGLVNEFEPWISDLNPVTIVVDVSASYDSNEYTEKPFPYRSYGRG